MVGPYGEKLDLELENDALGLWPWAALSIQDLGQSFSTLSL